jgi:hypothetical protein
MISKPFAGSFAIIVAQFPHFGNKHIPGPFDLAASKSLRPVKSCTLTHTLTPISRGVAMCGTEFS